MHEQRRPILDIVLLFENCIDITKACFVQPSNNSLFCAIEVTIAYFVTLLSKMMFHAACPQDPVA